MPTCNLDRRQRGLPRSGQTTSYATGDSGNKQSGCRSYLTRQAEWIDMGDGTVHDRATGLFWVKQPELIIPGASVRADNQIQAAKGDWANSTAYVVGDLAKDTAGSTYWVCVVAHTSAAAATTFAQDRAAHPTYWRQTVWTASAANLTTPATMTWANMLTNAGALSYAGFADWRLANNVEYMSALDHQKATSPMWFTPLVWNGSVYLSADTVRGNTNYVWYWQTSANSYIVNSTTKASSFCPAIVRAGRTL